MQQQTRTIAGMYKLRDWIKEEDLDFHKLSMNTHPAAMALISENINRAWWPWLSSNPSSLELTMWISEKIDWNEFSSNTNDTAVDFLISHPEKINWRKFSANSNPKAVEFLYKNLRKISWPHLFKNPGAVWLFENQEMDIADMQNLAANPAMIHIIRAHMDEFLQAYPDPSCQELFWHNLSQNPAAIDIIEKYPDCVDWNAVCRMPEAISLIEKKLDTYFATSNSKDAEKYFQYGIMSGLSKNPAAIDILHRLAKRNIKDLSNLSANPAIFTYDYEAIRNDPERSAINDEFMATFWNPERVMKMRERAGEYASVLAL